MTSEQAIVGTRVKALVGFSGVPRGTEGVIDEDYGTGVTVAWDGPPGFAKLPEGYRKYDGKYAIQTGILRDGFDKQEELKLLGLVIESINIFVRKTANETV
jgi:hypothetical protein